MLIKITDPITQTVFFSTIFLLLLVFSTGKLQNKSFFPKEATNQLKGFAILAIIFSHISYSLSANPGFLYPFSILAGVGVNLFLFLSGFGLTLSQLKSPLAPLAFYKRRLLKLFTPLWTVITAFLLIDFFLLQRTYPLLEIIHSFMGFYPRADLWQNLDSPLWYFSVVLFYYLTFPFVFFKKIPLLSPILVLLLSILLLNLPLPVNPDVLKLYTLHFLAFPLGMLFGLVSINLKFKLNLSLKLLILTLAILIFLYTSLNSGIGQSPKIEQNISLITVFSLLIIFSISKINFRLLSVFGIYSYEIYLLHWPILSRFNLFLQLPPFLMTILNLSLILLLGYAVQKITRKNSQLIKPQFSKSPFL